MYLEENTSCMISRLNYVGKKGISITVRIEA